MARQLLTNLGLSLAVMLCLGLTGTAAAIGWLRLAHCQLLTVQTASMVPTFRPGDGVIEQATSPHSLRLGQIVSYRSPRNPNIVISHRLIKIDSVSGWLTTKGDAAQAADPSFPPQLLIGRDLYLLPGFGSWLNRLKSPLGLTLTIYLPAVLIALNELRRLANIYASPFYSVRL